MKISHRIRSKSKNKINSTINSFSKGYFFSLEIWDSVFFSMVKNELTNTYLKVKFKQFDFLSVQIDLFYCLIPKTLIKNYILTVDLFLIPKTLIKNYILTSNKSFKEISNYLCFIDWLFLFLQRMYEFFLQQF